VARSFESREWYDRWCPRLAGKSGTNLGPSNAVEVAMSRLQLSVWQQGQPPPQRLSASAGESRVRAAW